MNSTAKLQYQNIILGNPSWILAIGITLSVIFNMLFLGIILTLMVSVFYKTVFLKEYSLKLYYLDDYHRLSKDNTYLLVKGAEPNFLKKIEELIQQGKVVICQCPNKTILRNAVKHFVHERQGQIEFSDSDQLAVYCKELGPDYEFI